MTRKNPSELRLTETSVDHLLELLHWQSANSLARWHGLEDARLLREGVDSLPGRSGRLLLQLHVQETSELEFAIFLQFSSTKGNVRRHNCFDLARFQLSTLAH